MKQENGQTENEERQQKETLHIQSDRFYFRCKPQSRLFQIPVKKFHHDLLRLRLEEFRSAVAGVS